VSLLSINLVQVDNIHAINTVLDGRYSQEPISKISSSLIIYPILTLQFYLLNKKQPLKGLLACHIPNPEKKKKKKNAFFHTQSLK
jgi:hypothetical protein